jgi:O-antigen ligase
MSTSAAGRSALTQRTRGARAVRSSPSRRHGVRSSLVTAAMALAVVTAAAVLVPMRPRVVLIALAAVAGTSVALIGGARSDLVIGASLLFSGSVDLLRHLSSSALESVRASGAVAAGLLAVALVSAAGNVRWINPAWLRRQAWFLLFAFAMVLGLAWSSAPWEGLKDAVLVTCPLAIGLLTHASLSRGILTLTRARTLLFAALAVTWSIVFMDLVRGSLHFDARGIGTSLGPRSLALFLLPVFGFCLASWRHGERPGQRAVGLTGTVTCLVLLGATLSRTPVAIAVGVLFPVALMRTHSSRRALIAAIVGICLFALLFKTVQPFQERFFYSSGGSLLSLRRADVLNTQGRSAMWSVALRDIEGHHLIGNGTGSARPLMLAHFGLEHPHSDYVKAFHDLGIVGLSLLVLAWTTAAFRTRRSWARHARASERGEAQMWHMASFLASLSMLGVFLTDNAMVYICMTIPASLLIAVSDHLACGAPTTAKASCDTPGDIESRSCA